MFAWQSLDPNITARVVRKLLRPLSERAGRGLKKQSRWAPRFAAQRCVSTHSRLEDFLWSCRKRTLPAAG